MKSKFLIRDIPFILSSLFLFCPVYSELVKQLEELTQMSNELITISSIALEFEKELIKLQKEHDALNQKYEKAAKQVKNKVESEKISAKNQELQSKIDDLTSKNTDLDSKNKELSSKNEQLSNDLEKVTGELEKSTASVAQLNDENKGLKDQIASLKDSASVKTTARQATETPAAEEEPAPAEPSKPAQKEKESKAVKIFKAKLVQFAKEKNLELRVEGYQELKDELTKTKDTDYLHQVAPLLFAQVMKEEIGEEQFRKSVKNDITKIKKQIQMLSQFIKFIESLDEVPALKPEEPDTLETYKDKVQSSIDALQKYVDEHSEAVKEPEKAEVGHLAAPKKKEKIFKLADFDKKLETLKSPDVFEAYEDRVHYATQLRDELNDFALKEKTAKKVQVNRDLKQAGERLFMVMRDNLYKDLKVDEDIKKAPKPLDAYQKNLEVLDALLFESFMNGKANAIIKYIDDNSGKISRENTLADKLEKLSTKTKDKIEAVKQALG